MIGGARGAVGDRPPDAPGDSVRSCSRRSGATGRRAGARPARPPPRAPRRASGSGTEPDAGAAVRGQPLDGSAVQLDAPARRR